ncbi:Sir2 family transcriptional regulator [Salmonella enterica subsp. enterica]|nr:Sir2 family transcriptional regulator [Salmonella enterica subsp. enterica serovar Virchow]
MSINTNSVPPSQHIYQRAAQLIYSAEALLVTAGAGMGVDSGLPDFRGKNGFYTAYPQFRLSGRDFRNVASPFFFTEHPRQAWGFYTHRFHLYRNATPHSGYKIIADWLAVKNGFVFTTNVDGHFLKAGCDENSVIEYHGSINHLQCFHHCTDAVFKLDTLNLTVNPADLSATGDLPVCPVCGGMARPNILMFNDTQWNETRTNAQMQRYIDWQEKSKGKKLVVLEIGAGSAIPSARIQLPDFPRIRINPFECDEPSSGVAIRSGAAVALTEINRHLHRLLQK